MREKFSVLLFGLSLSVLPLLLNSAQANETAAEKEWTFLVYLNGNNNLDRFGTLNINQMESVGSTKDVNVVVEWGSYSAHKVRRLYVQKDHDMSTVTSPVVQDMGVVDMGDWHSLVDFIRWGAENYPAKHYFVSVWDHGSGWHMMQLGDVGTGMSFHANDISWDDISGNYMTTEQLGQAITEASNAIGRKIDVYGSDACLMAMGEVAGEMSQGVNYFVGSQDLEPGAGWPYDTFLARWTANPAMSPRDVAIALTEEYKKSYSGGSNGTSSVTLSAYDMGQFDTYSAAISQFGSTLRALDAAGRAKAVSAIQSTQTFTYSDYGDLGDFMKKLASQNIDSVNADFVKGINDSVNQFLISNQVTSSWSGKANGITIWLPKTKGSYSVYSTRYKGLNFDKASGWSSTLASIFQ